jgi:hypothetical protein
MHRQTKIKEFAARLDGLREPPVLEATQQLVTAIREYESDTFSATGSGLKLREAFAMATLMITDLAEDLGFGVDGMQLSEVLDRVRGDA